MKRMVLYILFLGSVVLGWHAVKGEVLFDQVSVSEKQVDSEVGSYVDPMIYVLTEANRHANVFVRSSGFSSTNLIRRFRSNDLHSSVFSVYLKTDSVMLNHQYKSFLKFLQNYAAHLKDVGYYIYVLREIII